MLKFFTWGLLVTVLLFGCNAQTDDVPTPVKPIPEKPATPPEESPRPAPIIPKEVPVPAPSPVKLEVQEQTLETLAQPKDTSLHDEAPTKQTKAAKADKKVNVSGSVLMNDKVEKLQDSVSGGEVKVDIKLD
ncbi:hypothetical protein [uncultured Desulfuromonas sp.]|uniref:hypothetical protein n=1 Tax=uncultured Desulfuromonas sp. TaxID=181013 RepID=UPI002AAAC418|nr:hypothetical protein [uncultured Desulfuromonas sp.]